MMGQFNIKSRNPSLRIMPPVSFLDMILLEKNAKTILTDSGGVQKEAYFHKTPCITLRNETEWTETVEAGWNQLTGTDENAIIRALENTRQGKHIEDYGTGDSAGKMIGILLQS
jgi:UDP-GlcNAc3NAcA epimerase